MVGSRSLIDTRYNNITYQSIPRVPGSCNRNTEGSSWETVLSCSLRDACCFFYVFTRPLLLLVLCWKASQEATFQKKVVFLFWKDIQSLRKAGTL